MAAAVEVTQRFLRRERRVSERFGIGAGCFLGSREGFCLEKVHFILLRGEVKEAEDCCRFSATECVEWRML